MLNFELEYAQELLIMFVFLYIFGARFEEYDLDVSLDLQDVLTKHHSLKAWRSGDISPYILNLVSEWMRRAGFTLRHLYSFVLSGIIS
jgi:hypothetical protein